MITARPGALESTPLEGLDQLSSRELRDTGTAQPRPEDARSLLRSDQWLSVDVAGTNPKSFRGNATPYEDYVRLWRQALFPVPSDDEIDDPEAVAAWLDQAILGAGHSTGIGVFGLPVGDKLPTWGSLQGLVWRTTLKLPRVTPGVPRWEEPSLHALLREDAWLGATSAAGATALDQATERMTALAAASLEVPSPTRLAHRAWASLSLDCVGKALQQLQSDLEDWEGSLIEALVPDAQRPRSDGYRRFWSKQPEVWLASCSTAAAAARRELRAFRRDGRFLLTVDALELPVSPWGPRWRLSEAEEKLGELREALGLGYDLVSNALITAQLEQSREDQKQGRSLQTAVTLVTALLLVPTLVAAIYGANVALPDKETSAGLRAMVAFMGTSALFTFVLVRVVDRGPLLPLDIRRELFLATAPPIGAVVAWCVDRAIFETETTSARIAAFALLVMTTITASGAVVQRVHALEASERPVRLVVTWLALAFVGAAIVALVVIKGTVGAGAFVVAAGAACGLGVARASRGRRRKASNATS